MEKSRVPKDKLDGNGSARSKHDALGKVHFAPAGSRCEETVLAMPDNKSHCGADDNLNIASVLNAPSMIQLGDVTEARNSTLMHQGRSSCPALASSHRNCPSHEARPKCSSGTDSSSSQNSSALDLPENEKESDILTVDVFHGVRKPMVFFVGLTALDRYELARSIVVNGGRLSSLLGENQSIIVLMDKRCGVKRGGRRAYSDSYVAESLAAGRALDLDSFLLGRREKLPTRADLVAGHVAAAERSLLREPTVFPGTGPSGTFSKPPGPVSLDTGNLRPSRIFRPPRVPAGAKCLRARRNSGSCPASGRSPVPEKAISEALQSCAARRSTQKRGRRDALNEERSGSLFAKKVRCGSAAGLSWEKHSQKKAPSQQLRRIVQKLSQSTGVSERSAFLALRDCRGDVERARVVCFK